MLLDVIPVSVTDVAEVIIELLDITLVDVTEFAMVEVADNELVISLLDITLVDTTDDVISLLEKVFIGMIDNVEDALELDVALLNVIEGVEAFLMFEMASFTVINVAEVITAEGAVANEAEVKVAGNEEVYSLLNITLVDKANGVTVSLLLSSKLVSIIDGVEITLLLEMLLTEVTDKLKVHNVLLDTDLINVIDPGKYCSVALAGKTDIVEFSATSVTVLEEVTVCTEFDWLLEATVVEVTDNVEVLDNLLVTVTDCVVGGCPLFDMTFTLVTDDVEDGSLLDIELFNTVDGAVIILLFEMTLE